MINDTDWLRGTATALVTPFTRNGSVDEERLRGLIERQISAGVKLLVSSGIIGETAAITSDEQDLVLRIVVEQAAGRARVIAGTGCNATATSIERAQTAQSLGADALLVPAPYHNRPTRQGLGAHFVAVAEALPEVPVIISNVRGISSSNISSSMALRLGRKVPNIVGIKDASANISQTMTILRARPAGFRVFSGDDATALPLIVMGADGVVSIVANQVPELMRQMIDDALAGDWIAAREIHYRLYALIEANALEPNPVPVMSALAIMGLVEDYYRLPLVPLQEKNRGHMRDVLVGLGLLSKRSPPMAGATFGEEVRMVKKRDSAAAKLGEESSYEDETEMMRRLRRGDETKGDPDERDVAGAPDTSETPEGREEHRQYPQYPE
jgi:4-hydroxy-tetrahydrodipicolinate synthase